MMPLLVLALLAGRPEKPTVNGDWIGTATSDRRGHLTLQLRSVQCDGMVAEALYKLAPTDADYASTLAWADGIAPGTTKSVYAKALAPCSAKRKRRR